MGERKSNIKMEEVQIQSVRLMNPGKADAGLSILH